MSLNNPPTASSPKVRNYLSYFTRLDFNSLHSDSQSSSNLFGLLLRNSEILTLTMQSLKSLINLNKYLCSRFNRDLSDYEINE